MTSQGSLDMAAAVISGYWVWKYEMNGAIVGARFLVGGIILVISLVNFSPVLPAEGQHVSLGLNAVMLILLIMG